MDSSSSVSIQPLHVFLETWASSEKGVDAKIRFILSRNCRDEVRAYLESLDLPSSVRDVVTFQKAFYLADHSPSALELSEDEELRMRDAAVHLCVTVRSESSSEMAQKEAILAYFAAVAEAMSMGDGAVKGVVLQFLQALKGEMDTQVEADPSVRDECIAAIRTTLRPWSQRLYACGMTMEEAEELAISA